METLKNLSLPGFTANVKIKFRSGKKPISYSGLEPPG